MMLRLKGYLILTVILCSPAAYGQNPMPVKETTTAQITSKVKQYNDSALFYTYINTGKSLKFGHQALAATRNEKDSLLKVNALINLARSYYVNGDYEQSVAFGLQAGSLSKKLKYNYGISFSINNLGLIYLSQENFKSALLEFKKALKINESVKDVNAQATNYFNIALCYLGFDELENAEKALQKSIAISQKLKHTRMEVMGVNRLGEIAYKRKQYGRSLTFYSSAIAENTIHNEWEYTYSYTGMALSLYELKRYNEAISRAKQGLSHALSINAKWDTQRALQVLHQAYAAAGDFKNAYVYYKQDKLYSDSLYSEQKDKEISRLQLKQKQIENEELAHLILLKQQRNQLDKLIIIIISIAIVFLVIILLIIRKKSAEVKKLNNELLKSNKDIAAQKDEIVLKNQELSDLNHSKDQLFSVVGHDLRSPIVSLIQTVDLLRSNNLSAEETTQVLDHFFEKLTATATMLDNLLLWANNQKNEIKVERTHLSLPQLVKQLLMVLNFQAKEKNIQIHHRILNEAFIAADLNHARIIMHNLISNAIKFTPSEGNIYIHYFIKHDKVGVVIRDTGVGMTKEKLEKLFKWVGKEISTYGTANEKGIGIGLMLVKKYAAENHADIIVNSDEKGTEFVICFDPGRHP